MGYQKKLKGIGEFKKNQLLVVWQFVCHFVIRSLSGRTGGTNNMGIKLMELVWTIYTGNVVNYGQILWDDFLQYIPRKLQETKQLSSPLLVSGRFVSWIYTRMPESTWEMIQPYLLPVLYEQVHTLKRSNYFWTI